LSGFNTFNNELVSLYGSELLLLTLLGAFDATYLLILFKIESGPPSPTDTLCRMNLGSFFPAKHSKLSNHPFSSRCSTKRTAVALSAALGAAIGAWLIKKCL